MSEKEHAIGPDGASGNDGAEPDSGADLAAVIQPDRVRVWEDEFHHLCVSVDGEETIDTRAVHAFPVSLMADYVSFLDTDGKEVALVAHPHKLDKASRRVLRETLAKMYYLARITQVYSVKEKMGVTEWQVMTDRGYASFEVVDRQHIRPLPGNRFEIENAAELDDRSLALIRSET